MVRARQREEPGRGIPPWKIQVTYVEACNCDYGCPCNFSGFPTYGHCRGLILNHIVHGHYGSTRLDGLSVVEAVAHPRAIHQGDGTLQLYVSKQATAQQRTAITSIFSGRAKGTGPFALLAPTYRYIHEPEFVDLQVQLNGKNSRFAVPGILEVHVEPFRDPVSGAEQETEVHVPKGFIWRTAQVCKTKIMRIISPRLSFDESGQHAAFCEALTYKGP